MKRESQRFRNLLKLTMVTLCLVGFTLQTWLYLAFYWTYPTVVDIQESIPIDDIDIPAISFCNSNGLDPSVICKQVGCFDHYMIKYTDICGTFKDLCLYNNQVPAGLKVVLYHQYLRSGNLNASAIQLLRKPVSEFLLSCQIIGSDEEIDCAMDDLVLASYYSDSLMFNFCYTINSVWGKPNKKIQKIGKYDKIVMKFLSDLTDQGFSGDVNIVKEPRYNYPGNSAIQILIHSPYVMASPYTYGAGLLGGKNYRIRLKMKENHLLPFPYQTNCTNYMLEYNNKNRLAPLNPAMALEECKFKMALEWMGCVPFNVDYPHNETLCRLCDNCSEMENITDICEEKQQEYGQPCNSYKYVMKIQEKSVYTTMDFVNPKTGGNETFGFASRGHSCVQAEMYTLRCQVVNVEILFDDFEIESITYIPRIETMELLSALGGYMGMYLGVSFVAMYDLLEWTLIGLRRFVAAKRFEYTRRKPRKKVFPLNSVLEPRMFRTRPTLRKRCSITDRFELKSF